MTNALEVDNLKKDGLSIGGSVILSSPIVASPSVGAEHNLVGNINKPNVKWYHGVTLSEGVAVGAGGEGHIEWGYTTVRDILNIFEAWNWLYGKAKGNLREEAECKN